VKVLVTPRSITRSGHPSLDVIEAAGYEVVFSTPGTLPTEEELLALLPGCVGYLAGVETISARVLDAASDLRVISRNGTGVDSIDLDAAERNAIRICRAEGANARGVAELTIGHVLALARSLPFGDNALKTRKWERRKGIELEGRTLGIVGCGKIGQLVAGLARALGMRVLAYDPFPSGDLEYCSMGELLAQADVITLHCPPSPDGSPIIDAEAVASTKRGVLIVNTARGGLLDADATLAALEADRIAGVALDAFESEPPEDWRLVQHPRVIASAHVGGFTQESVDRAMSAAVENLLAVLRG